MKKVILFVFAIIAALCSHQRAIANVRLPSIIGNHMVLQQQSEVNFWGWGDPQEKITIQVPWDTTHYTVLGTRNAVWQIKIKTPAAGGPYAITITGRNTIILEDVLVGEVWLCGGQSNMEWNVNGSMHPDEAKTASNNNIRFFQVTKFTSDYPQDDVPGSWVVCSPESAKWFSAVGYFFGRKLQQTLNAPVGLISANWGGTPAEVWTPKSVIEGDPVLKADAANLQEGWPYWPIVSGKAYNAMINPLTNFSIAGALWYQGEANVGAYANYPHLLTSMIGAWRTAWNKEFPFYYVQIAPFNYGENNLCAFMREAQTTISAYPKTGMVVVSDLVENVNDIHPRNKLDVGIRLANYALADTYGKTGIAYKSPQYKSMNVEKNKIRISFDNVPTGLKTSGGEPTEFYIAGADQNFVKATAKIDGNTVVVSSKEVKNPVAVRFGFSNTATPNLLSKEGLPVNLFRTDNWVVKDPVKK